MDAGEPAGLERVSAHVWRLPLPSRTLPPFEHVNVYLVASNGVCVVVDPGAPGEAAAGLVREALARVGTRLLKAVMLTHTHPDHLDGLEALLAGEERCAVYVHPLEADRVTGVPTLATLAGDRRIPVGDVVVRSLHTPGHSPGHLCFLVEEDGVALAGDLVAGKGSVWVGVPEGDVSDYLDSLARLRALAPQLLAPGHGPVIADVDAKLMDASQHRLDRERQVLAALSTGSLDLAGLRQRVYPSLPQDAHDLAERSLLAHLRKLMREMRVVHLGDDPSGPYALRR